MRPRKYGDRTLQEIFDLWKSGYPVQELAEMFNYHPNDHSRLMHYGIRLGLISKEEYEELVRKKKSEGGRKSPKYSSIPPYRTEELGGLPKCYNGSYLGGITHEDQKTLYSLHAKKYT